MRIASLSPATTEILFAMEQGKHIVCTDQFSDFPEAAKQIPHLKDHQRIDPTALDIFKPEVIFTSTLVQEKLAAALKKEGLGVIHQDPRTINDVYESIRQIGMIAGCDARALVLVDQMQRGFNDTKRKSGLLSKKPKVYVEEWHNPPMVSGNWVPDVIKLAGGTPFPLPAGSASREVTIDEVRAFDPDVIVLSICGAGSAAKKDLLLKREEWKDLRAVLEDHLFVIDDSLLNRPGPRLCEGAKRLFGWIFQVMH
jgi:iron complex transport system substrate-binding protein